MSSSRLVSLCPERQHDCSAGMSSWPLPLEHAVFLQQESAFRGYTLQESYVSLCRRGHLLMRDVRHLSVNAHRTINESKPNQTIPNHTIPTEISVHCREKKNLLESRLCLSDSGWVCLRCGVCVLCVVCGAGGVCMRKEITVDQKAKMRARVIFLAKNTEDTTQESPAQDPSLSTV